MKLSEYRRKKKMTQYELGIAVGVTQRSIANYENGDRKPSPKVAERIAKVLEMDTQTMWDVLYKNDASSADNSISHARD